MKIGSRLASVVDSTEVVVVKAPPHGVVSCGGSAMVEGKPPENKGTIDPAHAGGTKTGKRYTDAAGTIELLCVKPGQGGLALDGAALQIKEPKPLPSSD